MDVSILSPIVGSIVLIIVLNVLFSLIIVLLKLGHDLLLSLLEDLLLVSDLSSDRWLLLDW